MSVELSEFFLYLYIIYIYIYIIASVASYICERSELYVRVGWRISLVYIYIYIYIYIYLYPWVDGPAWAPRNAQRANVGPAGLGSMVNVIALKTATLVLSRG